MTFMKGRLVKMHSFYMTRREIQQYIAWASVIEGKNTTKYEGIRRFARYIEDCYIDKDYICVDEELLDDVASECLEYIRDPNTKIHDSEAVGLATTIRARWSLCKHPDSRMPDKPDMVIMEPVTLS